MATTTPTSTVEQLGELLESQHTQVEQLIEAVSSAEGEAKATAFARFRRFLAVHEAAEAAYLHPLAPGPATTDRVEEEEEATEEMSRLEKVDVHSREFDAWFADLTTDITAHAEAEEHEELPTMRDVAVEELGKAFVALQMVPELAEQSGGALPDGPFPQLFEAATEEFRKLEGQRND